MLSSPALKSAYDDVVWLYVYRDFSSSEADRKAERVLLRFGVSSWPQLFLADPATLEILAHTGRSVKSFLGVVGRTRVTGTRSREALERLRRGEELAIALEKRPSPELARQWIDSSDIVVRVRALRILAEKEPKAIVQRAQELLQVPNDPFRYEVCRALQDAADPSAARALEAVAAKPEQSLNPNVLRIRAVQALAACGDRASVEVIRPFAQSGAFFNGLTGVSVDALAAIAKRDGEARAAVREALRKAYPEPADPGDERATRACVALARRVHRALGPLGGKRAFPKVYDASARAALMR